MCKKIVFLVTFALLLATIPMTALAMECNQCYEMCFEEDTPSIINSLRSARMYDVDGNEITHYINYLSLSITVTQEDILQASLSPYALQNQCIYSSLLSARVYDMHGNDITDYVVSITLTTTMTQQHSFTSPVQVFMPRDMGPVATIWINCHRCGTPILISLFRTGLVTAQGHEYTGSFTIPCS